MNADFRDNLFDIRNSCPIKVEVKQTVDLLVMRLTRVTSIDASNFLHESVCRLNNTKGITLKRTRIGWAQIQLELSCKTFSDYEQNSCVGLYGIHYNS